MRRDHADRGWDDPTHLRRDPLDEDLRRGDARLEARDAQARVRARHAVLVLRVVDVEDDAGGRLYLAQLRALLADEQREVRGEDGELGHADVGRRERHHLRVELLEALQDVELTNALAHFTRGRREDGEALREGGALVSQVVELGLKDGVLSEGRALQEARARPQATRGKARHTQTRLLRAPSLAERSSPV